MHDLPLYFPVYYGDAHWRFFGAVDEKSTECYRGMPTLLMLSLYFICRNVA